MTKPASREKLTGLQRFDTAYTRCEEAARKYFRSPKKPEGLEFVALVIGAEELQVAKQARDAGIFPDRIAAGYAPIFNRMAKTFERETSKK